MNRKWMILPVISLAVFGLLMMSCNNGDKPEPGPGNFTPVNSIDMTSSQHLYLGDGGTSVSVTLAADVVPSSATNKTIAWSLGDGSTASGAAVTGGKASATGAGIIKVKATIANGKTATTPYTKDFEINVYEGNPTLSIKYGETTLEADLNTVGGTIDCVDGNYIFSKTEKYEGSFVYFKLDIAKDLAITDLSDIYQVKVGYEGISGDLDYKEIALVASDTEFGNDIGGHEEKAVNKPVQPENDTRWLVGPRTADTTTLDIWPNRAKEFTSETYFSIYINTEDNTIFRISNVEFVKRATQSKFDAVTAITIVKNSFYTEDGMTLSSTIVPPYATNQEITWEPVSTGTTASNGTVTSEGDVSAEGAGDVVVKATITNGATESTAFTAEFTLTAKEGSAPTGMSVDVAGTPKKNIDAIGVGGTTAFFVDDDDDSITGVTFTKTANYQQAYVYFDVPLGEALSNFSTVTLQVEGLSGDLGYKRFALMAVKPPASGTASGFPTLTSNDQVINNSINGESSTGDNIGPQLVLTAKNKVLLTFSIEPSKLTALNLSGETTVRFAIFYNATAGVIEYSEIAFAK